MTYLPHSIESSIMPTTCERVPPQGTRFDKCLDLSTIGHDDLPIDPRNWSREEVGSWVARSGGLPERFPMNGKALCLMSKEMFTSRVPNFGHILYQDFRKRLARALALQELSDRLSIKK